MTNLSFAEDEEGYVCLWGPDFFFREHQLNALLDNHLSDVFSNDTVVHHQNKMKFDNRRENLETMVNTEHANLHGRAVWMEKDGEMKLTHPEKPLIAAD